MLGKNAFHARRKAPHTWLYRVFHYQHRMPHDVVMKQGGLFPAVINAVNTYFSGSPLRQNP